MKDNYELLEFPMVKKTIGAHCITQNAKRKTEEMAAYKDLSDLREELDKLDEAMTIHRLLGHLPLGDMKDVHYSLKKAQMDGVLICEELYDIFHVLENVTHLESYFSSYEGEIIKLRDLVEGLQNDTFLRNEIERIILPDMTIDDHASETLYKIRKEIKSIEVRIRKTMESYLKEVPDALSYDNLTVKNDRLVLAVKASHKADVTGLVHSTSQSGQTFFIEPERSVALNNSLNELRSDEQEEITKILRRLTRRVKQDYYPLKYDCEIISELDFIFGKARYANSYDCAIPTIHEEKVLSLKQARHPLIDQETVVGNDIILEKKMLMITGSNTGGKTVALKTAGLLSLMALSGLAVPCVKADIGFFDEIYVDIGDEQSIAQSLSTYSSHMSRIIDITRNVTDRSLVLIDEIGSGTDPQEGSCLAEAIIEDLLEKNCKILASTHYGQLKAFAEAHPDICSAAVGFDLDTMKPTYKLKLNSVGMSYAFEIAESLGLDEKIIQKARKYKEESLSAEEQLMDKLEKQERALNDREEKLNALMADNEKLRSRYEGRIRSLEHDRNQIMEKAHAEANQTLENAKEMIDAIVADLRSQAELKDHLVTEAKHSLNELKFVKKEEVKVQDHTFKVGDHVRIDNMNREGDITEVGKKHMLIVDVGGLPLTVKDTDVTYLHPKSAPKKKKANVRTHVKKTGHYEVNVIGMRYSEAMQVVDKFLDDALVLNYPSVRIVHGIGTGALRKGIRKMLDKNKNVDHYSDGGPNEGGLGVTLVYFE